MSRGARKGSAFAMPDYVPATAPRAKAAAHKPAKPLAPTPTGLELSGDDWQDIMGALQCGIKDAQAEGDTRKVDRLVRLLMTASNALVTATRASK